MASAIADPKALVGAEHQTTLNRHQLVPERDSVVQYLLFQEINGIQKSLPAINITISNTEFLGFWIVDLERNVHFHNLGLCLHHCSLHLSERDPFAIHRQHMNRMLSGSFGFGPLLGITDGTTPGARQPGRRMQVKGVLSTGQDLLNCLVTFCLSSLLGWAHPLPSYGWWAQN